MADTYTIQFRRGMYADFDTSKIRPGEPVAILGNDPSVPSGKALYIAFAANDVRRLCSIEDISEMVNAGEFVGPQGPKGEKGERGEKGADGTVAFESLTPEQKESLRGISIESASVDTDGNLTITFSNGDSEDVGNIMGPQGIQGPKGDKGDVGPQGLKGDKGDVGPKGDNMSDEQAAQIEQNKKDVDSLKGDLSNITNGGFFGVEFDYIEGGYLDQTNGNLIPYNGWKYTDYIDISNRDSNILYLLTDGAKSVYNTLYDENHNFLFNVVDNVGYTEISQRAKYIRLSCKSTANQTLKIYKTGYASKLELYEIKSKNYLRIATYNVGIFNNGISGVETENAINKMNEFRKIIGFIDADILNTQEFKEYFDSGNTYSSLSVVNFKYPYNSKNINANNSVSFSKYNILNPLKKAFNSGSGKYYIAFDIVINDKTITIINAHLSIEEDVSIHRSSEIAELIAFMNTKDYVILTGDMNASSQSEYDAYKTAGYTICNGGYFGWFNTWPIRKNMPSGWNTEWPCENLDNIIVSSNITPQYVETIDCGISDHAPLVATLRID